MVRRLRAGLTALAPSADGSEALEPALHPSADGAEGLESGLPPIGRWVGDAPEWRRSIGLWGRGPSKPLIEPCSHRPIAHLRGLERSAKGWLTARACLEPVRGWVSGLKKGLEPIGRWVRRPRGGQCPHKPMGATRCTGRGSGKLEWHACRLGDVSPAIHEARQAGSFRCRMGYVRRDVSRVAVTPPRARGEEPLAHMDFLWLRGTR